MLVAHELVEVLFIESEAVTEEAPTVAHATEEDSREPEQEQEGEDASADAAAT
jgi:hypothetical protein